MAERLDDLLAQLTDLDAALTFQGRLGETVDVEMRRLHGVLCDIGRIQVQLARAVAEQALFPPRQVIVGTQPGEDSP